MKKLLVAIVLLISFIYAGAQAKLDSLPAYERIPTVPPFRLMVAPDSTVFTKEDIKRRKALIIVVFSPDCEHCKHFTKELLAKYGSVKKAKIIMSSVLPYDLIRKFYADNKISDYPAITMGQDENNFLGTFFTVRSFPTVVVYNKKGIFVKRFDGAASIEAIAAEL